MPDYELKRLQEVNRYLKLKISKEKELQEITEVAAKICNSPIALITLIDEATQYMKFKVGTSILTNTRENAFCNYVISQDDVVVIPDTGKDPMFAHHPLRDGETNVQFYAGAPLKTKDGLNLGSLCVIDHQAGNLTDIQITMLGVLAQQVIHILESDLSRQILNEQYLETKRNEITLRSLFESSGSCQMLIDRKFNLLFFNKAIFDFMLQHYNRELALGQPVTDFIGADFYTEFVGNCGRVLLGETITSESHLQADGISFWWQFNYSPAYDPEGEIIGISYNATNVTDLKVAKAETIEHEQMLKAIAFIQAHELRRPVSSILGLMSLIKMDEALADIEEVVMLERAALEMDSIIRRLVSYTD